jgi:glycolate oxidase iron-sulfur subunit
MRTQFSLAQLADHDTAEAESVIRKCVHCGFCTATCPTYVLSGDERDSPRGRIHLIQDMLEGERSPSREIVHHIDRCLSCLGCTTTCPSGVDYMYLVDYGRSHIERHFRRPMAQRLARWLLARVLIGSTTFRWAVRAGVLARKLGIGHAGPLAPALTLLPKRLPRAAAAMNRSAQGLKRGRALLLQGCVEPVLRPQIRQAAVRMLSKSGFDVVFAPGEGCCGAFAHHMGKKNLALAAARRNVYVWERTGADMIVATAAGCGTMIKDYRHLLAGDSAYAKHAARISAMARDISEAIDPVPAETPRHAIVAYHSACSLQHGQKIDARPKALLRAAGFVVKDVPEGHLCCGSAGIYNILQQSLARQLRARKLAHVASVAPDVVAAGNIGCIVQLAGDIPVVHTVELLDWAAGGPLPDGMEEKRACDA